MSTTRKDAANASARGFAARRRLRRVSVVAATMVFAGIAMATPAYAAADFQVTLSPTTRTLPPGGSVSFTVQVGKVGTFASPVTLSISGLPSGVTAQFSVNPVTPSGTSSLTLTATTSVASGTYVLPVQASGGGITHIAGLFVRVDFALKPIPTPPPPCFISVVGTVTDSATHQPLGPLQGASVNGEPTNASGQYTIAKIGGPTATVTASASNYWFLSKSVTAACGGTAHADFPLVLQIQFDIAGRVVEGVADAASHYLAVKKLPETPIAGADVTAWTSCGFFGNDGQVAQTGPDGTSIPAMKFLLSYNNAPRTVFSFASLPEHGSPDGCPPPHPYPPELPARAIDGYWWSSAATGTVPVQVPARDVASTPDHLHITEQFLLVKKCSTSVSGTVRYGTSTGPVAAGVKLDAQTNLNDYPYRDSWDAATDAHTSVVSDSNGNFAFPAHSLRLWFNNQPTTYSVFSTEVPDPPHADWSGTRAVALAGNCADQPTVTVVLHAPPPPPPPPGAIQGDVFDQETGNPVPAGHSVCAGFFLCAPTNSSGHYLIPNVPASTFPYQVVASPGFPTFDPDYWSSDPVNVTVNSGQTSTAPDLKVLHKRFAAIAGVVRDPATGLPVPNPGIVISDAIGSTSAPCPASNYCITTSNADGSYRIDHIELGYRNTANTATITVFKNRYVTSADEPLATFTVGLTAGKTTTQDAELEKVQLCRTTATIVGNVTNANTNQPIANATVSFSGVVGLDGSERFTVTDGQGNYVLSNIPVSTNFPVQAEITATANGFFSLTMPATLSCGAVVVVDGGSPACALTATLAGPPKQIQ
ncbi:MAG: serine protease, partial [Actinomycetota bacterium]|nr:serine protease [Actinomycetota bacterium]